MSDETFLIEITEAAYAFLESVNEDDFSKAILSFDKSKKKRRRKSDTWKKFFSAYPNDKKGGTDQKAWDKAKKLMLDEGDFELMLKDVTERSRLRPLWKAKFAHGITRYMEEKTWLTPVTPERLSTAERHQHGISDDSFSRDWADSASSTSAQNEWAKDIREEQIDFIEH